MCCVVNCIFTFHTFYATIHVICTKLEIMKLEGCTYELIGQTKVNKNKNTNGSRIGNYPCGTIMPSGFLKCFKH
jgi:hypothetical protein